MLYKISLEAEKDLEKIWLYTFETWSLELADHYFSLIMNEIEYLAQNPKSGINFNKIRKGYFQSQIKSHLIFYKLNFKTNELEIIRILHQRMDIESRLDD